MTHLVNDPQFWLLVGSYWIFSAATGALPHPKETAGQFYVWFFGFMNALAGNVTRAFGAKVPGA
jgi:hypothetical protein